jgi:hypothetical protein
MSKVVYDRQRLLLGSSLSTGLGIRALATHSSDQRSKSEILRPGYKGPRRLNVEVQHVESQNVEKITENAEFTLSDSP